MKSKTILATVAMLISQFAYPCGGSDKLLIYLGNGTAGLEEIKVILDSTGNDAKKAVKISDDDGIANLFLMTSLTKGMNDSQIKSLQEPFVNSLNKAINYYEDTVQKNIQIIADKLTNPLIRLTAQRNLATYQAIIPEMKALELLISQEGLTRENFGTLINKIIHPISDKTVYQARVFQDGEFKMMDKSSKLKTILGEEVFNSIAGIDANGNYPTLRGGCGVTGVLADPTQISTHPESTASPAAK